jgi:hypothetical protein
MLAKAYSRLRSRVVLRLSRQSPARRLPVLYIPGLFGTKLFDRQCGEYIWGDYRGLLFRQPREADYGVDHDDPWRVLANQTLYEFQIVPGLFSSIVTRDVVNVLEVGLGYRLDCDLFFLAYDWRADYRRLGRLIEIEIERLQSRFGADQKIIIIGQSVANMAIRYWLRECRPEMRESVAKWYAFGPPWRGSWNTINMLQNGYWPATRRFHGFSAEAVASCPSVYQLLPAESRLMDRHGDPVAGFDIFDARSWKDAGLPCQPPGLAGQLAQAKAFSQAISGTDAAEQSVPQTWFVNAANQAVSTAISGHDGEPVAATVDAIRQRAPDLLARCLEVGDDHFPLRHVSEAPCGPLVASPDAVPWGDNAVVISQAHDHRALINHGPNLRVLVRDMARLSEQTFNGFNTLS